MWRSFGTTPDRTGTGGDDHAIGNWRFRRGELFSGRVRAEKRAERSFNVPGFQENFEFGERTRADFARDLNAMATSGRYGAQRCLLLVRLGVRSCCRFRCQLPVA